MKATKQYIFTSLLSMTIASVFTMIGIIFSLIYLVKYKNPFWILPVCLLAFFGSIGQSLMIELMGLHLKRKNGDLK